MGNFAEDAYGVSAGLDLLSGVFGYLAAQNNASIMQSRADLIRSEAEANAQRYAEQAQQFEAHEKVMYLASGVTLAGSPVDVLAATARTAQENIAAIRMAGEERGMDAEISGVNEEMKGRNALIGGVDKGVGAGLDAYIAGQGGTSNEKMTGLGVIAQLLQR